MNIFSRKSIRQAYVQMLQHKGSPESVGRGAAIGLLVGFVIPFSFQMAIAFPLALVFKAAKFPALLFTWISNPVTIPFIYPIQCVVGSYLIGRPLSFEFISEQSKTLMETPTIGSFLSFGAEVVFSFFAGGLLFGAVAGIVGYFLVASMSRAYQARRQRVRLRKAQRGMGI